MCTGVAATAPSDDHGHSHGGDPTHSAAGRTAAGPSATVVVWIAAAAAACGSGRCWRRGVCGRRRAWHDEHGPWPWAAGVRFVEILEGVEGGLTEIEGRTHGSVGQPLASASPPLHGPYRPLCSGFCPE